MHGIVNKRVEMWRGNKKQGHVTKHEKSKASIHASEYLVATDMARIPVPTRLLAQQTFTTAVGCIGELHL